MGGPSVHVILLTGGLRSFGYETRLLIGRESSREGNLLHLAEQRGVTCVQIPGLGREVRVLGDLQAFWHVLREIRAFRPHVVHTHTAKAGVLGRVAAVLLRVPVIVHTYHGHVLSGYFSHVVTWFYRSIESVLSRFTTALVTVSESVREELQRMGIGRPGQLRIVELGLALAPLAGDLPRGVLRAPGRVPQEARLVGIVGRLVPIKDLSTFLRAAREVVAVDPGVHFAVVGDGESRAALDAEAAALGLSERVHFHGWKKDMREVFGDLDVAVNTSLNEGTPVALIEAMAAGVPVVATAVGGTPDLLGEGSRGLLVPPRDPAALCAAILGVLRERPEARIAAARRYVLERHSERRLVEDVDRLYRELLARHA